MNFWKEEEPQKEVIMSYVDLLVKDVKGVEEIVDKCIDIDVSADFCDHIYNVYKCFWDENGNQAARKLFSFHEYNIDWDKMEENGLSKE